MRWLPSASERNADFLTGRHVWRFENMTARRMGPDEAMRFGNSAFRIARGCRLQLW